MSQNIAAIDVHKKLLVAVITSSAKPDVPLQSRRFGSGATELHHLLAWLFQYEVAEAVMQARHSTGSRYGWNWSRIWRRLSLSPTRRAKGRKSDLADAKRLRRRFVAGELDLSFIPESEQRAWRMVTRGRLQLIRERVQWQNQIESLLEEGRIKLSSVISDLPGAAGGAS